MGRMRGLIQINVVAVRGRPFPTEELQGGVLASPGKHAKKIFEPGGGRLEPFAPPLRLTL
jgi:hypothetical protein